VVALIAVKARTERIFQPNGIVFVMLVNDSFVGLDGDHGNNVIEIYVFSERHTCGFGGVVVYSRCVLV
jgi:hypothetical protein